MQERYKVRVKEKILCFSFWKTFDVVGHKVESAIVEHGQLIVMRPRLVLWRVCGTISVVSAIDGKDYEIAGGNHGVQTVRGEIREADVANTAMAGEGSTDRGRSLEAGNGDRPGSSGGTESYPWAGGEGQGSVPEGDGRA